MLIMDVDLVPRIRLDGKFEQDFHEHSSLTLLWLGPVSWHTTFCKVALPVVYRRLRGVSPSKLNCLYDANQDVFILPAPRSLAHHYFDVRHL
jgi:hypothetical protein